MAKNTIPLKQAKEWAATWRKKSNIDIRSFLIPNIDVTQILDVDKNADIRAYVGINDKGEPTLMLVRVDEGGNDMIDEENGDPIYDFTRPCPSDCDPKSPLNTLE